MPLITDTDTLDAFCKSLVEEPFITVDTEFMREKTYWPILCLVQVAGTDDARVIDAMAPGIDLAPLFELMDNPKILKVFHAARQDLEIFYQLMGHLPTPLFDTQIAAMVCGFGDSVGYQTLIEKLTKAHIDKSSRFTDWSVRPLSERQITYALSDVTHLRDAYRKLADKLHQNGREAWLDEEMETLMADRTYDPDPQDSYRRIKSKGANPRLLAILRELAAWRELECRKRDLPRNRVLRDEALLEIAHHTPKTVEELARTRGLGQRLAEGSMGAGILEAVIRGKAVADADLPKIKAKKNLPRGIGPIIDLLKVLLKMKCDTSDVAQKLLASSADIEQIAAFGEEADVAAMHGWRRELFGEDALRLKNGEIGFAIKGQNLSLITPAKD
ncbi:MAG: ribonuclease D [Rhodospirillaceae bacterium]|nr:ribonuclease D [Rhodospirillaceae bacterium]